MTIFERRNSEFQGQPEQLQRIKEYYEIYWC